ncbi:MAG TPA: type II toxin-antitoxin system HicA family toxin [Candidatus Andersenbacteria bacterium]|nr:type II toxin-antitoxin system HicA family toxin [Candidatus Andersenbacteria bacterium]
MARLTPLPYKKFEKFLLYIGCTYERQKGSHKIYSKAGLPRPIVVPTYKLLPVMIIKNNLRTLGLSQKQYFEILKKL